MVKVKKISFKYPEFISSNISENVFSLNWAGKVALFHV